MSCSCFDEKNIDIFNDDSEINKYCKQLASLHICAYVCLWVVCMFCVCVCAHVCVCVCACHMYVQLKNIIIINLVARTSIPRICTTKNYIYFVKLLEYVRSSRNNILMVTMVMCAASFFEGKKLATPARIPLGIAGIKFKTLRLDLVCEKVVTFIC